MFKGSRFCAQCGAEATREMVPDGPPLECPRCAAEMQTLMLGTTMATECAECGGLWLNPAALQALCSAREAHAAVVNALAARVPARQEPLDTVRYIPCPRCGKLMNRQNFARSSGVITDVCKADGVWLDRGELQRVIGFVDSGGLAVQRARELEQLAEEQRRLTAMQAMGARSGGGSGMQVHVSMTSSRRTRDENAFEGVLFDLAGLFNTF